MNKIRCVLNICMAGSVWLPAIWPDASSAGMRHMNFWGACTGCVPPFGRA